MKKYLVILLALAMFAGEATAKSFGGGSRSSFGSSRSSFGGGSASKSSWFSSKPSTPAPSKPASAPVYKSTPTPTPTQPASFQTNKSTTSTFGKPAVSGAVVGGAVVGGAVVGSAVASTPNKTSSVDAKLAQRSATAGKPFQSKADAENAYKQKLASQSKYTSATPPKTRPDYVPSNVNVGGRNVNVTYHSYNGGGYGYGYYDPMTHAFVALAATQMIVNASHQAEINHMYQMQNAQIAQQNAMIAQQNAINYQNAVASQPVYHQPAPVQQGHSGVFYFFVIIGVLIICVIVYKVVF